MANLSIPSIRERLFNTSKHEQTTQRNTNPFSASTFKGNVLTADVFESSTKQDQPAFTGIRKLEASLRVGSISGIGERFQHMINSVVEFGVRAKESVVNYWNKLEGIEISFDLLKKGMVSAYNHTKEMLSTQISEMFSTGISPKQVAKMVDMTEARQLLKDGVTAWEAAA